MRLRREALPPDVANALPLTSRERVLAASRSDAGEWHAATDQALYVAADGRHRRIAWECIDRVTWDRESERLVVVEVADFGVAQPRHELALPDPSRLLEVVRERVTASVVMSRHVPVTGSRGLKVVARRSPAGGGELTWSFWLDTGLSPDDPAVLAAAEQGLAHAKDELGI